MHGSESRAELYRGGDDRQCTGLADFHPNSHEQTEQRLRERQLIGMSGPRSYRISPSQLPLPC